jgi:hypothetical protein
MSDIIKPIALYLPQYHPIPENDQWWGKGFTEWTNVTNAKLLFEGHWQPRLPADLGFYDLRVPEVREAQARLAKDHGIHGFCYWHYWFAGKRLLEKPFSEVVRSGKPDFPFCLAWANQTWAGKWHGLSNEKLLIEQTYPGEEDYKAHFYALLEAFQDPRYITVDGKRIFFVFRPTELPDSKRFIDCWQDLAYKEGLNGFHMVAMHMMPDWPYKDFGFDAFTQHATSFFRERWSELSLMKRGNCLRKLLHEARNTFRKPPPKSPRLYYYADYANSYPDFQFGKHEYPMICTDWDNTPRAGYDGYVFADFNLELFEKVCQHAFRAANEKPDEEKFVKSWNEWAEGNYMEPDQKYGLGYLETFKKALTTYKNLK